MIDKETQYFIAEATRTLSLSDTGQCEKVGDELWVGCATVPKEGRLCEVRLFLLSSINQSLTTVEND